MTPVLDVCCGSKMCWFNANDERATFLDNREVETELCDRRTLRIKPDMLADFTNIPFPDESFYLILFDPPHLNSIGENSWLAKKYGRLIGDWRDQIAEGFNECFRVLKTNGTLIFKWNSTDIPLKEILSLSNRSPLFGHMSGRQSKTHWICFLKS